MGCSTDWYWLLLCTIFVILVGLPFVNKILVTVRVSSLEDKKELDQHWICFRFIPFLSFFIFSPISRMIEKHIHPVVGSVAMLLPFFFFFCSIFCHIIAAFYFNVHYLSCGRF